LIQVRWNEVGADSINATSANINGDGLSRRFRNKIGAWVKVACRRIQLNGPANGDINAAPPHRATEVFFRELHFVENEA
jgi:hypothetical protein